MRILVLIKQVSDPESRFSLEQGRLRPEGPPRHKMSSYDEFALEAGLRLKESVSGSSLTALSVGPERAQAVLQRAGGMGADDMVRLDAPQEPQPRPAAVAAWVASWAQGQGYDLILTGVASEDAMNGATGPMLARLLKLPWATSAVEIEASADGRAVTALREMEGGRRQRARLTLPALVTVQSGAQPPRYPTLSALLRAKKTPPEVVRTAELAQPPQTELVVSLEPPCKRRAGLVLEGDASQKAARLLEILRERALL